MKKLVIGAVALCAAVVAQAAQVSWEVYSFDIADGDGMYNHNGYTAGNYQKFNGTAYLILASDATAFDTQLKKDGTLGTLTTYSAVTEFDSDGAIAETPSANTLSSSKAETFQVLLVETTADKTYWQFSTVSDPLKPSEDLSTNPAYVNWLSSDFDTATAESWSTYSVPEPTSGLLLLLGVAGLALRRRRA